MGYFKVTGGVATPFLQTETYYFKNNGETITQEQYCKEQSAIGEGFIDWVTILQEVRKTNCKIYAIEHDDPADYKDYTTKSLNFLTTIE